MQAASQVYSKLYFKETLHAWQPLYVDIATHCWYKANNYVKNQFSHSS